MLSDNRLCCSPREAAGFLGIGLTHFYQQVKEGRIKTVKLGKRTLVPLDPLRKMLAVESTPSEAPAN
jgi:excisionase family DNA binding protein